MVPGFTVTAEVDYQNVVSDDLTRDWDGAEKKSNIGGILRFQRPL
ncbi:hypothetical protein [Mesorhizobium australicum]